MNTSRTRKIISLGLALLIAVVGVGLNVTAQSKEKRNKALSSIKAKDLAKHVQHLGSKEKFHGRPSGTKWAKKASEYIIKKFKKYGLKPKGTDGYLQPFNHSKMPGSIKFRNVIGYKEGGSKKDEVVIIGGHYDHLGMGRFGSRDRSAKGKKIHPGADDNASGTAALIEIAEALQHIKPKRSIMIIAFDAEERGLLGSKHYTSNPTWDINKTAAMFNLDMIGRGKLNEIKIGPAKRNKTLYKLLQKINKKFPIKLRFDGMEKYADRSDQGPFLKAGVPGLFFFGGVHSDMHTPGDTVDKLKPRKMMAVARLALFMAYEVANLPNMP